MTAIDTRVDGFTLRPATEELATDSPFYSTARRIRKADHEVVATEAKLRQTLFGNIQRLVLLGFYRSQPVAFALFFPITPLFSHSPASISKTPCRSAWRGKGFGGALLRYLAHHRQAQLRPLEWSVLDWNKPAPGFYQAERPGTGRVDGAESPGSAARPRPVV